jgi:hypothetical protein
MKTIKDIIRRHFELGYVRQLLWVDCFFIIAFLIDAVFYSVVLGLPLLTKSVLAPHVSTGGSSVDEVVPFVIFLLIIVPVVITLLRVLGWSSCFLKGYLARSQVRVLCIHVWACLLFVYLFFVTLNMQRISGWQQSAGGTYTYSLHSYFTSLVSSPAFKVIFGSTNKLVGTIASGLLAYLFLGKKSSDALEGYLVRASLADLQPQYRPAQSRRFDAPNPSTLPRISAVVDYSNKILREYQDIGPGTAKATEYLDSRYSECVGTISEKLLRAPSPGTTGLPIQMKLYTGTKSAFQAALAGVSGRKEIVLSPYASPSLSKFLQWHCRLTGDGFRTIPFAVEDYLQKWDKQQEKILLELHNGRPKEGTHTIVFVLSEVFYGSGLRVPLKTCIQSLKLAINGDIHIIVDGTNAAGNRRIVSLDPEWDSYIFSPHKWLMATESCGIVLSRSGSDEVNSPSAWQIGIRHRDTMIRILAGLRGATELLGSPGMEYFRSRCEKLRQQLKLSLPESVQIVGDKTGLDETYISSYVPSVRNAWKFNGPELEEEIAAKGLNASVLMLDEVTPWIRIAIPYYLDVREITRVCDFLDEIAK